MSEPVSDTVTVRPSRTTLLFVTAAAVVIVVGGIKAANHIVAPVMLSLSLVIVVHPLRASSRGTCRDGRPPSSCS